MSLFKTRAVTVVRRIKTGTDELEEPTMTEVTETVKGVLIAPVSTQDLEAYRNLGYKIALNLHFPKTYKSSLAACFVEVDGRKFRVIGDPQPYMEENTRGRWNRVVGVELCQG